MGKRGPKVSSDPSVEWKISVRGSTAAQVELILTDPVLGKPKKGARSKLINQLLSEWLERQKKSFEEKA